MELGFPARRFVRESRPFDFVYDHVYTTSSGRDAYNTSTMAARTFADIKLRPVYPSMFTGLQRERLEACIVDKQNPMSRVPTCGPEAIPWQAPVVREVEPTGADRALFALQYASNVDYKLDRPVGVSDLEEEIRKAKKSAAFSGVVRISRGVQSDYRETETQTDPYSPPYKLPFEGAYPRALALTGLTWGKGLPPTLDDIVTIERALTRRTAEMTKTAMDNEAEYIKHSRMVEELEAHFWAEREKDLYRIMEQKKEIMKKLRHDMTFKMANMSTHKLERIWDSEKQKNIRILHHVRYTHLREMRKLERKFCKSMPRSRVDGILTDHGFGDNEFRSKDVRLVQRIPDYDFRLVNDFETFNNLTNNDAFKKKYLNFDCQKFTRCILATKARGREQRMERMLEDAFNAFRLDALKKPPAHTTLLRKIKNQLRRIPTPIVEGPALDVENIRNSVILLQKIIRGRAVQTMMREELRGNASSLADLRALHQMDPSGLSATLGEMAAIRLMRQERENEAEKENEISEITDQLEGETLAQQLDFLEKEMVRLQDERKIHCLLILAERERRMKEAIEAGRRQEEEDESRVNDEIFRQIVGIQQSTVDIYLEDMYLNSIERSADGNARAYVQNLASTLNEAAYMMQNSSVEDCEEMTADIVHSFLMPEMNRIYQRQRMDALQNRYMRASHDVTHSVCIAQGIVREVIDALGPAIQTHFSFGKAAIDGSQIVVDEVIREAVENILPQGPGLAPPPTSYPDGTQQEEFVQGERIESKRDTEQPQAKETSVTEPDDNNLDVVPIDVITFGTELVIKSIEGETGTEIGMEAINLMLGAEAITNTIFEETTKTLKACLEEETEGEDVELDWDDDDDTL